MAIFWILFYLNWLRFFLVDKPLLVLKPKSDNYFINSKIELICEAKGFPEPQIEWFKENNEDLVIKYDFNKI